MLLQEVNWLRTHRHKLSPDLKNAALTWYRPLKNIPLILQKPLKFLIQRWYKIPVIIQVQDYQDINTLAGQIASLAGCKIQKRLPEQNSFASKVNAKNLEILAQFNSVKKIWYNKEALRQKELCRIKNNQILPGNAGGDNKLSPEQIT